MDKLNNKISNERLTYLNNLGQIENEINEEKKQKETILIKT
jgi:hypothetical protein